MLLTAISTILALHITSDSRGNVYDIIARVSPPKAPLLGYEIVVITGFISYGTGTDRSDGCFDAGC